MTTEKAQAYGDQLVEDFKKVMSDAEELLKATAHETTGKVGALRERAEENLREARRKLHVLEKDLLAQTKAAAKATDRLVHENPWQSVAIAAGVGLLFGMLSRRS